MQYLLSLILGLAILIQPNTTKRNRLPIYKVSSFNVPSESAGIVHMGQYGRYVLIEGQKRISCYDTKTRQLRTIMQIPSGVLLRSILSPNEERVMLYQIYSPRDQITLTLYDTQNLKKQWAKSFKYTFPISPQSSPSFGKLIFSPDSQYVAWLEHDESQPPNTVLRIVNTTTGDSKTLSLWTKAFTRQMPNEYYLMANGIIQWKSPQAISVFAAYRQDGNADVVHVGSVSIPNGELIGEVKEYKDVPNYILDNGHAVFVREDGISVGTSQAPLDFYMHIPEDLSSSEGVMSFDFATRQSWLVGAGYYDAKPLTDVERLKVWLFDLKTHEKWLLFHPKETIRGNHIGATIGISQNGTTLCFAASNLRGGKQYYIMKLQATRQ